MSPEHSLAAQENLNPSRLIDSLEHFPKARILIIGDAMIDEYLTGDAYRISPEAPVPVVHIENERYLVGGAGNVARNITALGAQAVLVGVRGSDAAGRKLERCLHEDRINFSLLTLQSRPTTVKTRILARQQQVLRFDKEDASALELGDTDAILALAGEHLPDCDAVVVSDYGKGLVSQRFMKGLQERLEASGRTVPLLVDPKPQNFSLYQGVTILTPNAKETSESIHLPTKTPEELVRAGQAIMEQLQCRHLLTTLGSKGMAVFESRDSIWHIPTTAKQVFDVTGAGDTVIAVLALGFALNLPLVQACLLANYAAGIVVAQVGAGAVSPHQLIQAVTSLPIPKVARWNT